MAEERMKILVAYDGSECAEAALDDLQRAGLPAEAEVMILSVYNQWLPAPASLGGVETSYPELILREQQEMYEQALKAAERVKTSFPKWQISARSGTGSPGSMIIQQADEWQPDLIVVGSHGRSALGRFFLGSVSLQVVNEAHSSVRVARGRLDEPDTPVRLVIGVDGSPGSAAAVQAVTNRVWPADSEVLLVNAAWTIPPVMTDEAVGTVTEWIASENDRVQEMIGAAIDKLQSAGLKVSSLVRETEPKKLLVDEAERWGADCIFLGARGMGRLERILIGSVSSGVAARAHCSVEVVRVS